jgi:hypothetical protein
LSPQASRLPPTPPRHTSRPRWRDLRVMPWHGKIAAVLGRKGPGRRRSHQCFVFRTTRVLRPHGSFVPDPRWRRRGRRTVAGVVAPGNA